MRLVVWIGCCLLAMQATAWSPGVSPRMGVARSIRRSSSSSTVLQQSSKSQSSSSYSNNNNNNNDSSSGSDTTAMETIDDSLSYLLQTSSNAYIQFSKENPLVNSVAIASCKTAAADVLAQTFLGGGGGTTPWTEWDVPRTALFFVFGGLYSGAFQYYYQVNVFQQLFPNVDSFTQQSWREKLQDTEGLKSLAGQTMVDLLVLTALYLPAFYVFKATVFQDSIRQDVTHR